MAFLSKRLMQTVVRMARREFAVGVRFRTLGGTSVGAADRLGALAEVRRARDVALQESLNAGAPHVFSLGAGLGTWVSGLENRRMIHGALVGGEVRVAEWGGAAGAVPVDEWEGRGLAREDAVRWWRRLPVWPEARLRAAATGLHARFYAVSGWTPELMEENRLRLQQEKQLAQAIEDQRRAVAAAAGGGAASPALYAFEKERQLLAHIRAGDRNGARRILNDMLAAIYLSSSGLVVLRARAVELLSCLTRAAIEDNPLMEPLIERNHTWTERLIRARSFEELSEQLMGALDQFIDGLYLHGVNRSNERVRRALDFIAANSMRAISLRDVARDVGLSACRLSHLVKQHTGRTVLQIVGQARIRQAQHLLERSAKSCTEIAYEVGFGDQSYFIKQFRRETGTTPARYRRARAG